MQSRRAFMRNAAAALAAPALIGVGRARAQEAVTLRLHHFLGPNSAMHTRVLLPWSELLREESGGRIGIDIFPAMQMGGTPPQLLDQARNGVVDIVWTLPANTPGRFPSTEAFELPFVAGATGLANAQACQDYAERHLADEVRDIKLLCFWANDGGVIHSNRRIGTMEDLRGLKLRNPTALSGEALAALGASPVFMPLPQVPEALAQGVIDGSVVQWEVVPALRLNELTSHHTLIPGTPTFYVASFFLAMNRRSFERLPDDLKEIVERNSGMAFARRAGRMWDEVGAEVLGTVERSGRNEVTTLSADEKARWNEATESVRSAWVASMNQRGLDGRALIDSARELVARYEAA